MSKIIITSTPKGSIWTEKWMKNWGDLLEKERKIKIRKKKLERILKK